MINRMLFFFSVEDVECAVHALECNKAAKPVHLNVEYLQCVGGRLPVLLSNIT